MFRSRLLTFVALATAHAAASFVTLCGAYETGVTELLFWGMFMPMHLLGQTDDIKTVSKFKKVFGGGDVSSMGMVSIKTNPKGAQIAVNRRIVDKASPADFYLNPGTYMVDITFAGYKDLHRVITVDKGGKVVIDETMDRQ